MSLQTNPPTITAMDLRKGAGTFLDRVDLRGERFIVERAGKPKAVIISVAEYEQVERLRREAKERFFAQVDEMRAAFADVDPKEAERVIVEAIEASRTDERTP
jgi:prevent-host-death family protein